MFHFLQLGYEVLLALSIGIVVGFLFAMQLECLFFHVLKDVVLKDVSILAACDDLARLTLSRLPFSLQLHICISVEDRLRDLKPIN